MPVRVDKQFVESLVSHIGTSGARGLDLAAVVCLLLPHGAVLVERDGVTSEHGLGGYHGSVHVRRGGRTRETVYYAVAVYSEGANGIVAFDAAVEERLRDAVPRAQEVRTDPDVEDAIRAGHSPAAEHLLGWYSPHGRRDRRHPDRRDARRHRARDAGGAARRRRGTAPVQLMWSNASAARRRRATS